MIDLCIMKIASVADIRNHFHQVSAWIENGESVEILKRGRPFARLIPATPEEFIPVKVDWEAQAKSIWRGRRFSADQVREMGKFEQEGEQG